MKVKMLITVLGCALALYSCDQGNQQQLEQLQKENASLREQLEEFTQNQKSAMSLQEVSQVSGFNPGQGKLISMDTLDWRKVKYDGWKEDAKKLKPKVKDGIYPNYFFIGLDKMNYMVSNSYAFNQGKAPDETIKGFAMTMGLKGKKKGAYIFDMMIIPQIDSANFLLINPPAGMKDNEGLGAFGDGSILNDIVPCPNNCNGVL
jgi:hypothetical protein